MKTYLGLSALVIYLLVPRLSIGSSIGEDPFAAGLTNSAATASSSHRKSNPEQRVFTGKRSDQFPNILLRTQDNKPVRFYDDLVKDKVVLVNFMYTTCKRSCVPTTAKLALVHKLLGKQVGRDIFMLSISLDPAVDTPNVLKEYLAKFGQFSGWYFLTGDYDEIERLRKSMGVYDLDPIIDADKTQHAGIITFGNDRTDRWSALPALMDHRGIVETVRRITRDR